MAGEDDDADATTTNCQHEIKSQNANLHSFVVFYNRTSRTVNILWCDYSGKEVSYGTLQPKRERPPGGDTFSDIEKYFAMSMDTFVTHPWVARDSATGHLLRINQRNYYLPVAYDGEEFRTPVYVDIPVFTLVDLCLEKVRRLVNVQHLSANEIPATLISRLQRRQTFSQIKYDTDYVNQEDENS